MLDVHVESLATSTALSSYYVPEFIQPLEVIKVLNEAGVRFMLAGLHGLGGWMGEPRATQDVDVLIWARHHKRAIKRLPRHIPFGEGRTLSRYEVSHQEKWESYHRFDEI